MKAKLQKQITKNSVIFAAAVSGLICSICLSVPEISFLIFFALIPFLFFLFRFIHHKLKIKTSIFIFSMCYHTPTLLWLYTLCPIPDTDLSYFSSWLIMSAAIIAASSVESLVMVFAFIPYNKLVKKNLPAPIVFSLLYILGEFLQEMIGDLAFPWTRLGATISEFAPFIQSASLFGTLFISLLILLINSFLALAFVRITKKKKIGKTVILLIAAAGIFISNTLYGIIRIQIKKPTITAETSVAVVQGNFGSVTKWDTPMSIVLQKHFELSEAAIEKSNPQIIVWSETAIASFIDSSFSEKVRQFAQQHNVTVITGIFDEDDNYEYNAMTAFLPDGTISDPYYKQKLVPMGEYVPFYKIIEKIFPSDVKFLAPGHGTDILETDTGNIGCIICYESVFPYIVRNTVNAGAQILAMASNDSWFGNTPALDQHLAHARMRAVENGRYLLRAGNTGISAIISPFGETEQKLEVNTSEYITANVSLIKDKTLYTLTGDIIILPCAALFLYGIWLCIYKKNPCLNKIRKNGI